MKKTNLFLLIFLLGLLAFVSDNEMDESVKYKMYLAALENQTTAPSYLVFIVKNKTTGETREFCTETPFFEGAISKEMNINIFAAIALAKKQKDRTFEFSKEEAFWNMNYSLYSKEDFNKYQASMDADKIVRQVKNGLLKTKTFPQDGKEQCMFAHLMFNHGVLTTRSLVALNTCDLVYFNDAK